MHALISIVVCAAMLQNRPEARQPVVLPRLMPADGALRVGMPVSLRKADLGEPAAQYTVVLRALGSQRILEPVDEAGKKRLAAAAGNEQKNESKQIKQEWTFSPDKPGAHIVMTRGEGVDQRGVAWSQRDKLMVPIADADMNATAAPSPSTSARFGEEIELTPLLDPTCAALGSQVPVQLKVDFQNRSDARLVVFTFPAVTNPSTPSRPASVGLPPNWRSAALVLNQFPAMLPLGMDGPSIEMFETNPSGVANVRIGRTGWWIVGVECASEKRNDTPEARGAGDKPPSERERVLRATLSFLR